MFKITRIIFTFWALTTLVFAQKSKVTSGSMAYNNGDFEQAIRLLEEALSKPELLENKDKAKAYFKKAQSLKGILLKQDAALLTKYPNAAFDAIQAYKESETYDDIKIFEKERESDLLMMANIMYQEGLSYIQKAGKMATTNPDTLPVLIEKSVKYIKTADELQPNNIAILALLGSALHYNKDDNNAIIALEKAVSLYEGRKDKSIIDKNMSSAYSELAEIYTYSLKDFTNAKSVIEKGKKEFPDVKAFDLLELNFYLSGDNIELGIQKFEKAIKDNPQSEEIHLAYADLLEKKGDIDGATKLYDSILAFNPSSFNANYNLAAMFANKAVEFKKLEDQTEDYSKAGEYAKSAETFFAKSLPYMEKAHQLDKEDIPTINGLVQVYTQLNMMEKSNEFIQLRNKLQGK